MNRDNWLVVLKVVAGLHTTSFPQGERDNVGIGKSLPPVKEGRCFGEKERVGKRQREGRREGSGGGDPRAHGRGEEGSWTEQTILKTILRVETL